jgi:signal recognition particle receptor subunit beta
VAQLDLARREITIKLVYYGPALSGKTTNLQMLHARAAAKARSRLMSLDTERDRTLFFDLLPLFFRASNVSVKFKVYTVPGQVFHNATRKALLRGVDGVAFIIDSQLSQTESANESYTGLRTNLSDIGINPETVPLVLQFNKRDLPLIRSDEEIQRLRHREDRPVFAATAVRDEGVLPTFYSLARLTFQHLDQQQDLATKLSLDQEEVFRQLGALFGE